VDCFKSLGIQCILAESFGAIYERNAINAAFPILIYKPDDLQKIGLENGDIIRVDFSRGIITNLKNKLSAEIVKFYDVQMEIYQKGGLLV
jgi:3-isopropylmalate dehydratase small subunit